MPNWKIKAFIQGTLSRLPDAQRWNRLLQQYVSRSLTLEDDYLLTKWRQSARHVLHYREHTGTVGPFVALELGTGWFPINPIGLALAGASPVYTIDRQGLLRREQVLAVLDRFRKLLEQGLVEPVSDDAIDRLRQILEASEDAPGATELLERLGVHAIVGDARATEFDTNSIDLICSNNTLEHIPEKTIEEIFQEFGRLLKPDGLMSHDIDLADHYTNFDRSISVYNFLRFSDREWQRYNNDLQYQNRLRLSDYRALHERTGWRLVAEENLREPLEALRALPLADQYRDYDELDLAVYRSWLRSVPESS